MRQIIEINDNWRFVRSAQDAAMAASLPGETVNLPHTWNARDGQDGGNDYYRGTCWYVRELNIPAHTTGRVYIEFGGAAMSAVVYLNCERLFEHKGGYSTFRVEITEGLRERNVVAVAVDNSENDSIYPQRADFTFYGGLYRSVRLVIVPEQHFALDNHGAPGIRVTPLVDLAAGCARVMVEAWQTGAEAVAFTVAGQEKTAATKDGHAATEFIIEHTRLWDGIHDPYLYSASAELPSGDRVETRFGCRSVEIDPHRGFLLNGRSYPLRGVSRHHDRKGIGCALLPEHHREDMEILLELGANSVRLAHYQHAQEFLDLCDEKGILVWAEIPYITKHMSTGRENASSQLEELIVQNYNHPSVAVWSISNEITAASAVNEELLRDHRLLNELCHRLDATRPTTMANAFMLEPDSRMLNITDTIGYNLYYGWYVGEPAQNDIFLDNYHARYPERPVALSEYGADANPCYQTASPRKGDYTEAYQALYHEHMLEMIEERPWLWASFVWNLFDFGADGRDEGGKHGENQKGLVTFDRRHRKDAFYLYKSAWSSEPVLHICDSRYTDRTESVTQVKIYTNRPEVALYVDGIMYSSQQGKRVFRFNVPISGEHIIEARTDRCTQTIVVRHTEISNQTYTLAVKSSVTNWFDSAVDARFYSIEDTLGELCRNPDAKVIVGQTLDKMASARGDVAASVTNNPALLCMLESQTLAELIDQSGDLSEQNVLQINRVLQEIKK